ncbi:MAG: serine protein kinase RIO [Planctomycetes bacterium]|nr:serine protein kinase RIO [Planctomycetota bacterium]
MHTPLDPLLTDGVIEEVLGQLMSGKEADIYLVRLEGRVVAAKVYKDSEQRSFRNNADYKEGRGAGGKGRSRNERAMKGRSRFGRRITEHLWKSAESDALQLLFAKGVRVPEPLLFCDGVLLMELVTGADGEPAPRLIDVASVETTARALYLDLRTQIVRMLCCDTIHGDLSPYNILAAAAGPTIIDFPQVVLAAHNSRSEFFFQRDVRNVHQFFAAADPTLRAHGDDGRSIWAAYMRRDLTPDFTPPPK